MATKNYGSLVEFSQKIAKEMTEKFLQLKIKSIKGNGEFEMIATSEGIDRQGEVILVSAWDFLNYMKNPVVLLSHDYNALPIGAITEIIPQPEEKNIKVKGVFANTDAGQEARKLYDDGILRAMSVGFMAKEREGNVITKAELLEISFVSVPANPDAVREVKIEVEREAKIHKLKKLIEIAEKGSESQEKAVTISLEAKVKKLEKFIDDVTAIHDHYFSGEEEKKSVAMKSGRVLSAKNLSLVDAAIKALSDLRNASEPEKGQLEDATKGLLFNAQALQKMVEGVIKKAKEVNERV